MSWMKRRTPAATPSPGTMQTPPPVQMYNPNQHSNQDWEQPPASNWYNPPMPTVNEHQNQQTYWQQHYPQQQLQQQQQQSLQHPQQHHQQQQQLQHQQYQYRNQQQNNYFAQQQQQPPQQTYESYNNVQYAPGYNQTNNYIPPQQQQQQQQQQQTHQQTDGWNSAWGDWGDEDNSNQNNVQLNSNVNTQAESWNWNVEDSSSAINLLKSDSSSLATGNLEVTNDIKPHEELFPKMGDNKSHAKPENLETVPLMPMSLNRQRLKTESLTPQWSIESQVSQESSDDVLQTSESDKLFSRSSTISHSPVSGHQTPQDASSIAGTSSDIKLDQVSYDNSENKEIIVALKEENDIKPPPMLQMPNTSENPFKKAVGSGLNKHSPPESKPRNFYVPPMNQSVNLETFPDNSEAPDLPEVKHPPAPSVTPFENNEVAPLNERNQYLETGQLSDENNDTLPPPGLSRMVLGQGQFGQGESNNEPPPGLSRMVLGQGHQTASPPAGLHRMIPGESSSPEARYPDEEEASDPELQQINRNPIQSRSATIGADTPPNRPEQVERETHLDGANTLDSAIATDLDNLTNSVRDLTVGENTSDTRQPSKAGADGIRRLESDSDVDRPQSSSHERKERRHKDDPRRDKRYSPDYAHHPGRDREKSRNDRRRPRDRNYEEDTDYYSDKERVRRRDERERERERGRDEYEKKYNSLRRTDRDKERRRRDDRDRDRERNHYGRERDYYNRYNDDEYDNVHQSSRPSSRSDSMHDSTYRGDRDRRRDRERDRERRQHRDPYNTYKMPGAYQYDPYNPYFQQYQYYLENLRRTDPQAYAEWYRKYYQQQSAAASSTYTQEEKTSVHSGRSSTNDDLAKERYLRQSYYGHASYPQMGGYYREPHSVTGHYGLDDSRPYDYTESSLILEDTTQSNRLTPSKFSTAHIKASISSGRMLKISPHYPMDGQSALVELDSLNEYLQWDDELFELEQFPGPLVRGVTHKKTIIEYCNSKIRDSAVHRDIDDPESYILMWELLILLIRQNGMVVGADIAELLMKDRTSENVMQRPSSVASNSSGIVEVSESSNAAEAPSSTSSILKEEYVTNKFREYLIYGSGQQALEWAMKHSLWGHALFLASKLDKRTYAKVMMRFANGLPMNDPLQTLYQLLSGHLPAAVTSVSDEKWGDWRPHLAMILSNTTQRPELDRKAITTLADTLMSRGSLYAAQFCYLMAEVGFTRYGQEGSKLVLLGGDCCKPFVQFAHNEAIHMTAIYEYACSLNDPSFKIPEFQAYKYLMATRLADRGFLESALAYVEQAAIALTTNPSIAQPSLINKVCDLAEQLKYYDPVAYNENVEGEIETDQSNRPDQSWLMDLKVVQQQYTMGLISHESVNNFSALTPDPTSSQQQTQASYEHSPQDPWTTQNADDRYNQEQQQISNNWQPAGHVEPINDYNQQPMVDLPSVDSYNPQFQEHTWNQQTPLQQWNQGPQESHLDQQNVQQQSSDYWNNTQIEEQPRPQQISMPNQSRAPRGSLSDDKQSPPAKTIAKVEQEKANASSTGWFGGIWSKLALRPKNQMKLPDDKNPTIVWDHEKKRWINLEEDVTDGVHELKPPPKMADIIQGNRKASVEMPPSQQHLRQQPQSLPNLNQFGKSTMGTSSQPQSLDVHPQCDAKPPLPSQNMFKMQRGRNLKKSYVDVFNPSGKAPSPPAPVPADSFPSSTSMPIAARAGPAPQAMNFFVPAPMDPNAPMDFLSPSNMFQDPNAQSHQS